MKYGKVKISEKTIKNRIDKLIDLYDESFIDKDNFNEEEHKNNVEILTFFIELGKRYRIQIKMKLVPLLI